MKKIIALMLAVVLCFTLCACSSKENEKEAEKEETTLTDAGSQQTTDEVTPETTQAAENETTAPAEPDLPPAEAEGVTPVLYKVSDTDGDVVWVFGSIHVGKEEFYPLPDYVMNAYNSSEALAVEANVLGIEENAAELMNAMKPLIYTDGTTIKDHVSEETYNAAVAVLTELGVYNAMFDYYCPAMWSSLIESAVILEMDVDATLGVDMHLLSLAEQEGKEILEIESVAFQYSMLAGFSEELQEVMLASSATAAADTEAYAADLNKLIELWSEGDENAIAQYLTASEAEEAMSQELYDEYNNAMIIDRNKGMTDYAVDALEAGDEIFICVGTAHVVGEDAIADNLRELGYTVELVR